MKNRNWSSRLSQRITLYTGHVRPVPPLNLKLLETPLGKRLYAKNVRFPLSLHPRERGCEPSRCRGSRAKLPRAIEHSLAAIRDRLESVAGIAVFFSACRMENSSKWTSVQSAFAASSASSGVLPCGTEFTFEPDSDRVTFVTPGMRGVIE
jgi:hypothetical protein